MELSIDKGGRIVDAKWIRGSGDARWDKSVEGRGGGDPSSGCGSAAGFPAKFIARFDVEMTKTEDVLKVSSLNYLKKFSKGHHSSLNELNITPLLDLAFVLLVIFIITTPQLSNDLEMTLPSAKKPKTPLRPPPIARIVVDLKGKVTMDDQPFEFLRLNRRSPECTQRTRKPRSL